MTHPRNASQNSTTRDQLMELLIHNGPDAMAQAFAALLNHAMCIECEQTLSASKACEAKSPKACAASSPLTIATKRTVARAS